MSLLYYVFVMSITGSLVFLLYKGLELLTKRYINATWHYTIIKCIAVFYLMPIGKLVHTLVWFRLPFVQNNQNVGMITEYISSIERAADQNRVSDCFFVIWMSGMVIFLLRQLICYLRFRHIITSNKKPADALLQWMVLKSAQNMGIKKAIRIYINENINTPMLSGFFKPIILLPSGHIDRTSLEYIISHELTHYKRRDLFFKLIGMITRIIHWFNPIVYLIFVDMDKWCEYACDEKNSIHLSLEKKKRYGHAILDAAAAVPVYSSTFGATFLMPKQDLKERLSFMLKVRKMSYQSIAFAITVSTILVFFGFITALAGETTHYQNVNSVKTVYYKSVNLHATQNNSVKLPDDQGMHDYNKRIWK